MNWTPLKPHGVRFGARRLPDVAPPVLAAAECRPFDRIAWRDEGPAHRIELGDKSDVLFGKMRGTLRGH